MRRMLVAAGVAAGALMPAFVPGPSVGAASVVSCDAPSGLAPATSTTGGFVGRVPERLVDTRQAEAVPAGCWLRVELPADVPAAATAVALSVTSDRAVEPGFLTVHSCGTALPLRSNLNVRPSGPTSNLAVVAVDSTRLVCIYSDRGTDVIVDLVGHFAPTGSPFHEFAPRRAVDTRDPNRRPAAVTGPLAPGQVLEVTRAVMGVPADATAVLVNLTVTQTTGYGYLTAHPCSAERPNTSNVNYDVGADRANSAIMALNPHGSMCVQLAESGAHVVVDVVGWFGGTLGIDFRPGAGRVADSRDGTGGWTGSFAPGETRSFDPAATGVLPDGTRVAMVGVIATEAAAAGFLSVLPCGDASDVSSLNYVEGVDITNVVAVPIADDGTVCVTSSERTHVVVDVFGGFRADGLMRSLVLSGAELFPAFRPETHDYLAYCGSNTVNSLRVVLAGMPRTTVRIDGGPPAIRHDLTTPKAAHEAIVMVVTAANGVEEQYWIRCVPPDFPRLTVNRPGMPADGWYLLGSFDFAFSGATGPYAMILDTNGVPVWYRKPQSGFPFDFKRMSDGSLVWVPAPGTPTGIDPGLAYERFELDGTPIREYRTTPLPTFPVDHHDLVELSNGNVLMVSHPVRVSGAPFTCRVEVPGAGFQTTSTTNVLDAVIQEIAPNGAVVWQWDADVLGPAPKIDIDAETTVPLCFRIGGVDYYAPVHLNSLAASGSRVLFTARHADAVYAVDKTTGNIEWKLGGTPTPELLTLSGDPRGGPKRAHDVRVLPNGNVSVFDNRTPIPGAVAVSGPARYVEYSVSGSTATMVREVRRVNGNFSGAMGSARMQPDGRVVVGWGALPGPVFSEVTPNGTPVLEVFMPGSNFSYRVAKEPPSAFDVGELRDSVYAANSG